MRIGILGSGLMGGTLGTILTRAGHEVVFSYSRSQRKLERLAKEAGGRARAGTPADAVADADAVLLAVHWSRLDDVLDQTGTMARKTIVTCSLPMTRNDSRLVLGLTTSGAEMLAARRRNVHVVSAFSTAPSEVFPSVFEKRRQKKRPSLVFCGDHTGAKKTAAKLIRDVGFDPVDVGELSAARYIEPFALLLAEIASRLRLEDNSLIALSIWAGVPVRIAPDASLVASRGHRTATRLELRGYADVHECCV